MRRISLAGVKIGKYGIPEAKRERSKCSTVSSYWEIKIGTEN